MQKVEPLDLPLMCYYVQASRGSPGSPGWEPCVQAVFKNYHVFINTGVQKQPRPWIREGKDAPTISLEILSVQPADLPQQIARKSADPCSHGYGVQSPEQAKANPPPIGDAVYRSPTPPHRPLATIFKMCFNLSCFTTQKKTIYKTVAWITISTYVIPMVNPNLT